MRSSLSLCSALIVSRSWTGSDTLLILSLGGLDNGVVDVGFNGLVKEETIFIAPGFFGLGLVIEDEEADGNVELFDVWLCNLDESVDDVVLLVDEGVVWCDGKDDNECDVVWWVGCEDVVVVVVVVGWCEDVVVVVDGVLVLDVPVLVLDIPVVVVVGCVDDILVFAGIESLDDIEIGSNVGLDLGGVGDTLGPSLVEPVDNVEDGGFNDDPDELRLDFDVNDDVVVLGNVDLLVPLLVLVVVVVSFPFDNEEIVGLDKVDVLDVVNLPLLLLPLAVEDVDVDVVVVFLGPGNVFDKEAGDNAAAVTKGLVGLTPLNDGDNLVFPTTGFFGAVLLLPVLLPAVLVVVVDSFLPVVESLPPPPPFFKVDAVDKLDILYTIVFDY